MNAFRITFAVVALVAAGLSGYRLGIAQTATPVPGYPADIDPGSHNRLPLPTAATVDDEGRNQLDAYKNDPNSLAGLQGPGGIRIYNSELNAVLRPANKYLRFKAGIPRNLAEVAILTAARESDAHFEWFAHEPAALKEGVSPATIDVIRYRRPLTGLSDQEAAIVELGREAVGKHKVSSATFQTALRAFGRKQLIAVVSLMGDYTATSILLATFDMQLPPGQTSKLPVP